MATYFCPDREENAENECDASCLIFLTHCCILSSYFFLLESKIFAGKLRGYFWNVPDCINCSVPWKCHRYIGITHQWDQLFKTHTLQPIKYRPPRTKANPLIRSLHAGSPVPNIHTNMTPRGTCVYPWSVWVVAHMCSVNSLLWELNGLVFMICFMHTEWSVIVQHPFSTSEEASWLVDFESSALQ